ncbi:hypothetical protein BBP00_00000240 [Phytophthora kernoviae]|uniref:MYND-type domain-containing protein n=1 Tax=Phytophthora kernoviae TaxID=325452 RepID=A0A3F2S3K1_9STRA|nr:hypothetical protein BBP00_00000240 [Phytophthora kernoviae]
MGRFIVTKQRIRAGERAFQATAFAVVVRQSLASRQCHWCFSVLRKKALQCGDCQFARYCSRDCLAADATLHDFQCQVLRELKCRTGGEDVETVRLALAVLSMEIFVGNRNALELLVNNRRQDGGDEDEMRSMVKMIVEMTGRVLNVKHVHHTLERVRSNAHPLYLDGVTCVGTGVFPEAAMALNHSCLPNVVPSFDPRTRTLAFHAIADIPRGHAVDGSDAVESLARFRKDHENVFQRSAEAQFALNTAEMKLARDRVQANMPTLQKRGRYHQKKIKKPCHFLGHFWNSASNTASLVYGQRPVAGGMAEIIGTNDRPNTDRLLACVLEGSDYKPKLLNDVLGTSGASVIPATSEPQVNGYRVVRHEGAKLSDDAYATYTDTCALISSTLDMILDTCNTALGYNVTRDALRVVVDGERAPGSNSDTMQLIADSLPVVIMPYWDSAPFARYAVPGWDGSACMLRLTGKYIDSTQTDGIPSMIAVNREVRETKTKEWLNSPDGKWRHGWFHVGNGDESETSYFSDVISTDPTPIDGLTRREFNTLTKEELDCIDNSAICLDASIMQTWGDKFSSEEQELHISSITIASAEHFGFFFYSSIHLRTVRANYDWETLIANVSLGMLLVRWIIAMVSLHRGFLQGHSEWFIGGLGCVAGSRSFNMLPITLLPHLKVVIASFWTAGCYFEGDQAALSESWFTVYLGLAEFCLVYYSLLNIFSKVTRRRITDMFFTPTLVLLCILHRCRIALACSRWLAGVDGRVTTIVSSTEMQELHLVDFFTSSIGPRMDGNLALLMALKLLLVGLNLLPLAFATYIPPVQQPDTGLKGVERALAIRASNVGGLGHSPVYIYGDKAKGGQMKIALNSYELVRLGYVVFGGQFLLTFDAWDVIMSTAVLHRVHHLWNYRVVLFPLCDKDGCAVVGERPVVCRLDDARLDGIPFWSIAAQPVRC